MNHYIFAFLTLSVCAGSLFFRKRLIGDSNKHKPDLSGQIIVITGAHRGIGLESAKFISALNPCKIILACRSKTNTDAAIESIRKSLSIEEGVIEF